METDKLIIKQINKFNNMSKTSDGLFLWKLELLSLLNKGLKLNKIESVLNNYNNK